MLLDIEQDFLFFNIWYLLLIWLSHPCINIIYMLLIVKIYLRSMQRLETFTVYRIFHTLLKTYMSTYLVCI